MKNFILLIAMVLLPIAGFAQSNTYHNSDTETLRAFLNQSSTEAGKTNE